VTAGPGTVSGAVCAGSIPAGGAAQRSNFELNIGALAGVDQVGVNRGLTTAFVGFQAHSPHFPQA
jgi:hypothetical protein